MGRSSARRGQHQQDRHTRGTVGQAAGVPGKRTRVETMSAGLSAPQPASPVQRRLADSGGAPSGEAVHEAASRGVATPGTSLPHGSLLQRAFGRHDISSITAHVGDAAGASARAMGAKAYATVHHVVFDGAPDVHTAAHEAAHVVQQRAGVHLKGGVGAAGDAYETHADQVADAVVAGGTAEHLLDAMTSGPCGTAATPGVQRALVSAGALGVFVDSRQTVGVPQQFIHQGGNSYRDSNNYFYQYTGIEEFEVTHGPHGVYPPDCIWDVEHQVELVRHRQTAGNGHQLQIYVRQGQNVNQWQQRWYYAPNHRYVQVPTQRVRWVDSRGQFVEQLPGHGAPPGHRVLTPDGQRVNKQYAVAQEGLDFVVPYKELNQNFLPGLPGVYGGNVDPGEDAHTAIGREMDEESGHGVTLKNVGAQLSQQQDGGNRYTISEAQVSTQDPTALLHEMAGMFQFNPSDFIGHTGTANAIENRLLALLDQHVIEQGQVAYHNYLVGLGSNARQQWSQSHGTQALIGKIRQDVQDYTQGLDDARKGWARQQMQAAYRGGYKDYKVGSRHAKGGIAPLNQRAAYTAAFDDYHQGRHDALNGAGPAVQTGAYALGYASVAPLGTSPMLLDNDDGEPVDMEDGDYV
jgi:ADP-ribose pyrophosphatase YjhB (NUDIX family)